MRHGLLGRLKRYSPKAITDALDPDFSGAVWEAVGLLEDIEDGKYEPVKYGTWEMYGLPVGEVSIEKFICLRCSNCNQFAPIGKYCKECGARMENG